MASSQANSNGNNSRDDNNSLNNNIPSKTDVSKAMILNGSKEISNNSILSQMFTSQSPYTGMNSMVVDRNKNIYKKFDFSDLGKKYGPYFGHNTHMGGSATKYTLHIPEPGNHGGVDVQLEPTNSNEKILLVECGSNQAYLYVDRLCQGSKGKSIFFSNQWLTPNEFQARSGRETAKDWKRSIRHRNKSLKVLMNKKILLSHTMDCLCSLCTTPSDEHIVDREMIKYHIKSKNSLEPLSAELIPKARRALGHASSKNTVPNKPKLSNLNTIVEELSKKNKKCYREKENKGGQIAQGIRFGCSLQHSGSRKRNLPIDFENESITDLPPPNKQQFKNNVHNKIENLVDDKFNHDISNLRVIDLKKPIFNPNSYNGTMKNTKDNGFNNYENSKSYSSQKNISNLRPKHNEPADVVDCKSDIASNQSSLFKELTRIKDNNCDLNRSIMSAPPFDLRTKRFIDTQKSEKHIGICSSKENTEVFQLKNNTQSPTSVLSKFTISSDQKRVWDDITQSAISLSSWNEDDVCNFLKEIGLEEYEQVCRENCITGDSLPLLRQSQLTGEMGFKLGHALKLIARVHRRIGNYFSLLITQQHSQHQSTAKE